MKSLLIALFLMLCMPGTAVPQYAILHWDDCDSGDWRSAKNFSCDTNEGESFTAYLSVYLLFDTTQVAAVTAEIEICVFGELSPWWLAGAGQCSEGRFGLDFLPGSNASSCGDFWEGRPLVQSTGFRPSTTPGSTLTIFGTSATSPGNEARVPGSEREWFVSRLTVRRDRTTGPGSCAGCSQSAAFALGRLVLYQPAGPTIYITNMADANLEWNGGFWTWCFWTPAQNRTWGAIKSMYH